MFQAFFGSPREKETVEDQQLEISDQNSKLEDHEAECKTTLKDAVAAQSVKHAHTDTSSLLEPGNLGRYDQPSSEHNLNLGNLADINTPSKLSSPRDEERVSQENLTEMMFREPIQHGTFNPSEYNSVLISFPEGVKEPYVSPFTYQADKETVIANKLILLGPSVESSPSALFTTSDLATRPRWDTYPESSISPLTLSQRSDSRLSVFEDGVDDTLWLDAEEGLLTASTPSFEVTPSPELIASTDLVRPEAPQTPSRASAVFDTKSISAEDFVLSSELVNCSTERETPCGTSKTSLEFDTARKISDSFDPNAPTVQFGRSETTLRLNSGLTDLASPPLPRTSEETLKVSLRSVDQIATKRVREIVAEDQSCDHDSIFYSSTLAGRKNNKRNFSERSFDTQGAPASPGKGEKLTAKRRRISIS